MYSFEKIINLVLTISWNLKIALQSLIKVIRYYNKNVICSTLWWTISEKIIIMKIKMQNRYIGIPETQVSFDCF